MYSREILILANSRKHSGHCIAGIDLDSGEWVRPINDPRVSRPNSTAFLDEDLKELYGDPFGPQLLDCVYMEFSKEIPEIYQPENELIKRTEWEFINKLPVESLDEFIDPDPCEWLCNPREKMDRISRIKMESNPVSSSLTLLHLNEADNEPKMLHSITAYGSPQTRLSFTYEGIHFNLSLTDKSVLQKRYSDEKMLEDFYLTVGIGELFSLTSSYHIYGVGLMPVIGDE